MQEISYDLHHEFSEVAAKTSFVKSSLCYLLSKPCTGPSDYPRTGNGSFRPRVVSALSRFGPGSFRPGSFRPGSFRPWVVSAQFGGSFRPNFFSTIRLVT